MRLNHVTLVVGDFERSREFYRRFGLVQIVDSPPRYARFSFPEGDSTLSIEVTGERGAESPDLVQVYIECDDLDSRVAALKSDGFVFDQEPTDMPYLWREARLRDPDQHQLRLFAAGENRLNPPWRVVEE